MGLVCGCTDKATRQGTKLVVSGSNEGGEISDNSMIYNENQRGRTKMKLIDMHIKNNEYRR